MIMASTTETTTPSIPREVRVDLLYIAGVVAKIFDPLKERIKERFSDRLGADLNSFHIEGDIADGILIRSQPSSVDPKEFYKLLKDGTITEKEFVAAIKVSKEAAAEVVHPKVLEKICIEGDVTTSLRVTVKKDVKLDPKDAASRLLDAITAGAHKETDKAEEKKPGSKKK